MEQDESKERDKLKERFLPIGKKNSEIMDWESQMMAQLRRNYHFIAVGNGFQIPKPK